ncbi:hypothetical protein BDF20DRAFT_187434 [Mycotypha africana]|uniref:uncharacterized protein n=1 Tax=Mycotypha africana TaxID=64632 RepID=UPI0023004D6F|nr:uncharacterized protein BDF20DRAFT_187434 [Mycotypha africana]KAI8968543.1 hypothetical protein BDF20DRAFT_187434 [Mycotypha africana]
MRSWFFTKRASIVGRRPSDASVTSHKSNTHPSPAVSPASTSRSSNIAQPSGFDTFNFEQFFKPSTSINAHITPAQPTSTTTTSSPFSSPILPSSPQQPQQQRRQQSLCILEEARRQQLRNQQQQQHRQQQQQHHNGHNNSYNSYCSYNSFDICRLSSNFKLLKARIIFNRYKLLIT